MAYQTGSATDLSDLLEKLSVFAASLGWVVDGFTPGSSPTLFLHNADGYWSFGYGRTQYNSNNKKYGLLVCCNTGYSGDSSWNAQPGSSYNAKGYYSGAQTTDLNLSAYISYDFFGTAQYLHVVVQIAAGVFRHFGIGTLNKEGDYIGGQYAYGSIFSIANSGVSFYYAVLPFADYIDSSEARYTTSIVRADMLGGRNISPDYYPFGLQISSAPTAIGVTGSWYSASSAYASHPDNFSIRTSKSALGAVVAPVPNAIIAICVDGLYRRLGSVPDMYPCRITGLTPRAQFDINGETWMTMPALAYRNTVDGNYGVIHGNSYDIGYAYRITP